jgi:FAD/FMN-containing dehydrogenase
MNNEEIGKFAQSFRGALIGCDHGDYDEVRKLYNGMIDKRPLLIARCTDVADVIAAVNFGRDSKLAIAIRGGGHNGPGFGSVEEGLVIDLSMMKGVRVDPANRTVRVGAGCTTGDVDHATHAFGLAIPFGIVSTTGVAGLTLSGGHGYLSRQYGLAIDNLIEADVVLADGTFVVANKTNSPDLLWGLRGGGGNFGVVTSFLFKAHPASMVYGGPIFWELEDAARIMRWYRDFQTTAPDEFYVFLGLQTVPSGDPFPKDHWGKKICVLVVSHNGTAADSEKAVCGVRLSAAMVPTARCLALSRTQPPPTRDDCTATTPFEITSSSAATSAWRGAGDGRTLRPPNVQSAAKNLSFGRPWGQPEGRASPRLSA